MEKQSLADAKQSLRIAAKDQLKANANHLQRLSHAVEEHLDRFFSKHVKEHGVWAAYKPMQNEVQINYSRWPDKTFVYPLCEADQMDFYLLSEQDNRKIKKDDIAGFLVPGLAFSRRGERLGRGKAFYDKYLNNTTQTKVGLSFDFLLHTEIPTEASDVPMDYVITDKEIIEVK